MPHHRADRQAPTIADQIDTGCYSNLPGGVLSFAVMFEACCALCRNTIEHGCLVCNLTSEAKSYRQQTDSSFIHKQCLQLLCKWELRTFPMNTNQYSELIRVNVLSTCQNYNDKSCCDDLILILNEQQNTVWQQVVISLSKECKINSITEHYLFWFLYTFKAFKICFSCE